MGYRSDVRIATTQAGYDMICKFVDELSIAREDFRLLGTGRHPEFFEERDGSVVFGWDWIKWYEGMLPDVTNVVSAIAEATSSGVPIEFCRVGETYDDIEFEAHNGNDKLSLHVFPDVTIDILC